MFKEVDMATAIMAAVKGFKVLRITENDVDEEEEYIAKDIRHEYLEFLLDDDKARFLIDDPDYKAPERPTVAVPVYSAEELARCLDEAEQHKPLHFDTETQQDAAETQQDEPEADHDESVLKDFKPLEVKKGKTAKKDIDIGKVQALHNAGWSIAKIADEMNVSASVIQRRLAALERAKNV